MRLAFDEDMAVGADEATTLAVPFDFEDRLVLARHLYQPVLVYRRDADEKITVVRRAELGELGHTQGKPVAAIESCERFRSSVPWTVNLKNRRKSWLGLDERAFQAICVRGEGPGAADGFSEAPQQAFAFSGAEPVGAETLRAFAAAVVRNYGHRCALTGLPGSGKPGMPDELETIPIVPFAEGGEMHVRNCLPLHRRAASAFRNHELTVGADLDIVVDKTVVDGWLDGQLRRGQRLHVPDDPQLAPRADCLAWHRDRFWQLREGW